MFVLSYIFSGPPSDCLNQREMNRSSAHLRTATALICSFAHLLIFFFSLIHIANSQTDVSDRVQVSKDLQRFDPGTGIFSLEVTITNISQEMIHGPIRATVKNLTPRGVTAANATGLTTEGTPFFDYTPQLTAGQFGVGQSVSLRWGFYNSQRRGLSFDVVVYIPEQLAPPEITRSEKVTASPNVIVSGLAPGALTVQIFGGESLIETDVTDGVFEALVPLNQDRINHLFITGVADDGTTSPPTPTTVIQDNQPPSLFIDFPVDGADLTNEAVDVAGRVGDLLSGFMGLEVTVNGQPANVIVGIGTNGSFEKQGVLLSIGSNTIFVTATDELGNTVSKQITVNRVVIPDDVPTIVPVSGIGQEGVVNTLLPYPIVVKLERNDGSPFANKLVSFKVTRSNGRLTPDGVGDGELSLQVRTDTSGFAWAMWKLGSDAGCGNNRVEVTARDVVGTTFFCASAQPAPPKQINIGSGNYQRAEAGGPAPEMLRVWVSDSCNGVVGVPVTFTVTQGGGKVNGEEDVTVNTGRTGHATVNFTLSPEMGNNIVEADFPGNLGSPAVFVLFGVERDEAQPTTFSGLVLNNSSQPIGGAMCRLAVRMGEPLTTYTNSNGQFSFDYVTGAGPAKLFVDGLVATTLNGQSIPQGSFPALTFEPIIVPNAQNTLSTPILLPQLNPNNARSYDGTQDVELTVEEIDGLVMPVRAGSMRRADGSVPSPTDPAILSLNPVHFDKVPMPMPDGASPPFAWTLQPGGATFDPPVEITYPNMSALPAGSVAYFLSFNHDTHRFEIVATGQVTADGSRIISDPGVGIVTAGWGGNCPPYSVKEHGCKETGSVGSWSPWSCSQAGAITSPGSLSFSEKKICIGESLDTPAITGTHIGSGEKKRTRSCTLFCSNCPHLEETAPVGYRPQYTWEPSIPTTFTSVGTFNYTAKVVGKSSDSVCPDVDPQTVGTLSVTVVEVKSVELTGPIEVEHNESAQYSAVAKDAKGNTIDSSLLSYEWRAVENDRKVVMLGNSPKQTKVWKNQYHGQVVNRFDCKDYTLATIRVIVNCGTSSASKGEVIKIKNGLPKSEKFILVPTGSNTVNIGVPVEVERTTVKPGTVVEFPFEHSHQTSATASKTVTESVSFGIKVDILDFGYGLSVSDSDSLTKSDTDTTSRKFIFTCPPSSENPCTFTINRQATQKTTNYEIKRDVTFRTGLRLICDKVGTVTLVEDLFRLDEGNP